MSPMTASIAAPATEGWSVDDVDAVPDDGLRYELVDGSLLVSPAPGMRHQRGVVSLVRLLAAACPPELEVFVAPVDFRPTRERSLQPDVLVVRREDVGEGALSVPPLLVVEVLSPSTRVRDLTLKRELYAQSGVASYWLLDPGTDPGTASLTVLALADGGYTERARVVGEDELGVDAPPVSVRPADLVR